MGGGGAGEAEATGVTLVVEVREAPTVMEPVGVTEFVGVRVTVRATPLRGGAYSLTVSADVPPRYFNATAGLLGDFDGVARNDLRTAVELPAGGGAGRLRARQLQAGGGAAAVTPRFTQRNAWEAVLARLSAPPAVSAALLLDPYPAPAVLAPPYVPVFTDEVHPATGAVPPSKRA